jgi:hypothetical protein
MTPERAPLDRRGGGCGRTAPITSLFVPGDDDGTKRGCFFIPGGSCVRLPVGRGTGRTGSCSGGPPARWPGRTRLEQAIQTEPWLLANPPFTASRSASSSTWVYQSWMGDLGEMSSLAGSFVKFGDCAAGHRIQLAIRERSMIFERREVRSVVGLAHDLLHLSQCSVHSAERWGGGGGGGGT